MHHILRRNTSPVTCEDVSQEKSISRHVILQEQELSCACHAISLSVSYTLSIVNKISPTLTLMHQELSVPV